MLATCVPLVASDYLTEGNDPGRTGWMKDEKVFTLANVKDMKLLWKVKLESQPREMHNLFSPLIADRVTTAQGAREVAIVAGISDDLFGIDVASGELLWKKRYESTFAPTDKTVYHTLCLGGQTAMPAMEQVSPGKYTIYAVAWDGRLHQINAADGADIAPPDKFLPPNGKPYALNVVNGVAIRPRHRAAAAFRTRSTRTTWRLARRACSCQRAAACGDGGARRFRPKASSTW